MTPIEVLIDLYHRNADTELIIKRIKNKREAKAFRLQEIKEAYRHIGDVVKIFQDVDAITKEFNLPPLAMPDFEKLHVFFKVR